MSDERQHAIFNSTLNFAIIATDLNGVVTDWNNAAVRVFGWSADEALGRTAHFFFTPEDRQAGRVEREMELALSTGRAPNERWHVRKDGSRFWAWGELTQLRDENDAHLGYVKILRDQTEEHRDREALHQAQAELRDSVDHYRATVDLNPQVNWTSDPQGNIDSYSSRWLDLTGQEPGEPNGSGWIKALHPDDVRTTIAVFSTSLSTGDPVDVKYRVRIAGTNGHRWMRARAAPRRNAKGEIIRWYGVVEDIHDQKLAEMELRASEEQFRVFAQAIPNHLWAARPNGELYWFNEQVYAFSGETQGTLEGALWASIVHPDDFESAAQAWANSIATGEIYETEFRIRRADGQYRWFLVRAEPVRGSDGAIIRWIGTNTDINVRKLTETESAHDRDRLWALSQDLLLVCDSAGVITTVNPSAFRILGWQEDEMIGHTLADFLHPDDLDSTASEVSKLATGATTLAFENRYRHKDGSYRLLSWTAVPEQGRIHAIGRDITEHRAVKRDQERSWLLSPVIKMVVSAEGIIQTINPGFSKALGWLPHEVQGRAAADFLPIEDRVASANRLAVLLKEKGLPEYQIRFIAKDRSVRRIAWSTILDEGTIFAFGRDVTIEHEQAEALAKSEEALRQSQKMEAVGQLTGGLAHDFNNLLAGITGSLELLERRLAQGRVAEAERYVVAAQGAARRAAALTHRLLAFSRRQTLAPKATDANKLVADMAELVRRTIGPAIKLEIVAAAGLWTTLVDPNQLENALLNLCINARDAMPSGGKLTIETANRWMDQHAAKERMLPVGQYVSLCVSDNGTGMTPEVIEKAFDPFFTTKPIGQGTGLGLSMIYGFARQSGGQVRIYSEANQGTMVCIYLPRHAGEAEEGQAQNTLADAPRADLGETVLVVDDEPTVRMLVTEVLEELGYAAIEAEDGPSGLRILQSGARIDLLVTDVGLPGGMNGRQMADAARVSRSDLRVLFITGYAENAVIGHGHLERGMHVMTKPFSLEALASRIKELIASKTTL